ncbi:MAG: glycosyltransferase family 4 protein [Proteobacteria bacterium]|nr:glycosyltransferase family 4 protein [Pseudomonadota bacterium]
MKLRLVVPGRIDQATGGYRYARRMLDEWRAAGHAVALDELAGRYPDVDPVSIAAARGCLARRGKDETLLIDGLALPAFEGLLPVAKAIALVHHPLGLETGLDRATARGWIAREAAMLRKLAGSIATSSATVGDLIAMGLDPARLRAVDPGTERARRRPNRSTTPTILTVATLTPRKDHRTLLRALSRLRDISWRSLCVGSTVRDAACAAGVRADIRSLGLGRRVRLAGVSDQAGLARHYGSARIFALPSRHEGYGMAFAEALAHGLPVAGVRAGAVPLVVPARAGLLVRAGDPAAFARALRRLLGPARRRYARNAAALRFPDWRMQAAKLWASVEALAP